MDQMGNEQDVEVVLPFSGSTFYPVYHFPQGLLKCFSFILMIQKTINIKHNEGEMTWMKEKYPESLASICEWTPHPTPPHEQSLVHCDTVSVCIIRS